MRRMLTCLIVFVLLSFEVSAGSERQPVWSSHAQLLEVDSIGRYGKILSPDGVLEFSFDGNNYSFKDVHGAVIARLPDYISAPELVELGWSSNSGKVFVNASDGGASGTWHTQVFVRSATGLTEVLVEDLIEQVSTLESSCKEKNVGAVGWLKNKSYLLVLEQVPASSGCTNMGSVTGYVVDVEKMSIVDRLTAHQLKAKFRWLLGTQGKASVE